MLLLFFSLLLDLCSISFEREFSRLHTSSQNACFRFVIYVLERYYINYLWLRRRLLLLFFFCVSYGSGSYIMDIQQTIEIEQCVWVCKRHNKLVLETMIILWHLYFCETINIASRLRSININSNAATIKQHNYRNFNSILWY